MDSELHIIVPGICGPLAETRSIQDSAVLQEWVNFLAKSDCSPSSASVYDVTSSIVGLTNVGDFPSAVLTLLANDLYDESMYYMHADPVHLRAELDHAVLTSSVDLSISEEESFELCNILHEHFSQDGLSFFRLNKNKWFVSSKNKITIKTTPLVDAVGRNVNFILPTGEDSSQCKQVLTEAQMLMHTHDVNVQRENTGQQIINSLWFYGSGKLPAPNIKAPNSKVTTICSNDDIYRGLSRYLKCHYIERPESVSVYQDKLLTQKNAAINLLHFSELENLTHYSDVTMWLEQLTQILDDWIYPLIKFSNKNNIKVTLYACNEKKYQFNKFDSLKFWRRGKVEQYVSRY